MKSTPMWMVLGGTLLLLFGGTANAWGGLFNRFSPEMLANMGYGNHGGQLHQFLQNEGYVEDEPMIEDEPCYGRHCTANEHCCQGSVCVDVDGGPGVCLFAYGRKLGELCRRDADCEAGLVCDVGTNGNMICRAPLAVAKQYGEECSMSSECDITRGLCCQLQRRHRQAARKICSYFKDPLICVGTVAIDQIKHDVQHTAGEKRITSAYKHALNGLK